MFSPQQQIMTADHLFLFTACFPKNLGSCFCSLGVLKDLVKSKTFSISPNLFANYVNKRALRYLSCQREGIIPFSASTFSSLSSLSGLKLHSCDGRMPQCLICPGRLLTNISSSGSAPPPPPPPLPLSVQVQDNQNYSLKPTWSLGATVWLIFTSGLAESLMCTWRLVSHSSRGEWGGGWQQTDLPRQQFDY